MVEASNLGVEEGHPAALYREGTVQQLPSSGIVTE